MGLGVVDLFIKRVSWTLLAFIILAVPVLTGAGSFAADAHAASSRVALIKELKGSVKVKKAGGSKEFTAFVRMSLNEGDTLSTGTGSSAVLQFANGTDEDDKMTVSANTKLAFSKLSDRKGTTTKVSMWSGSAWVDVKSIASANDEFKLETPTAVMGVRGTHLLVSVDPATGNTRLVVAAGVVRTETTDAADRQTQDVYPTQRAVITDGDEVQPGDIYIAPVDLSLLMGQSDANIVTAILGSAADIVDENARYAEQYAQQGLPQQLGDKPDDLNRFKSNTENLLGAIADQALKNGLLTQERLDRILTEVKEQSGLSIDLSMKQLAITEEEKNKQEEQRKLEAEMKQKAEEMRQKELELRMANEALQRQLEEEKKKQAEAKRKAEDEKKKKALEKYESGLSDAEKAKFEQEKKNRLAELAAQSPSPSPSSPPWSQPVLSNVASLSDLKINDTTLSGFNASTLTYSLQVSHVTAGVSVSPYVASGSNATVKVGGIAVASGHATNVSLAAAGHPTLIDIVVTAENGIDKTTYQITVNRDAAPVNSAPTDIMLSNATIFENSGIGYIVGSFEASDPDAGDTFTYELIEGTGDDDNGSFSIAGTELLTGAPVNYESKNLYSIRVRVTDGGGLTYERSLEIHVLDVDESLTNITIDSLAFFDYTTVSTVIGTLIPIGGEGMITYTFSEGSGDEDNVLFEISGNQLLTSAAYDDGLKGEYHIRVKATDSNGDEYEKSLTIGTSNLFSYTDILSYAGADKITSSVFSSTGMAKVNGHEYFGSLNSAGLGYQVAMRADFNRPSQLYWNGSGTPTGPIGGRYYLDLVAGWNEAVVQVTDSNNILREYKFRVWVGDAAPANLALDDIYAENDNELAVQVDPDGSNPFLWTTQLEEGDLFIDFEAQFTEAGAEVTQVVLENGQFAEEPGTMANGYRVPYFGTSTYAYIHVLGADGNPYIYKLVIEPASS